MKAFRTFLLLLLALTLTLSACAPAVLPETSETVESGAAEALDAQGAYKDGIAGNIAAGSILDWVYQTLPGNPLPAESAYKEITTVATSSFQAGTEEGATATSKFFSLSATDTTYLTLGGIPHPSTNSDQFYRMKYADRAKYSEDVQYLNFQMTGATLRFCTNADTIALQATLHKNSAGMNHFATKGSSGFDIYVGSGSDRTWVTTTKEQLVSSGTSIKCSVNIPASYKGVYKEVLIMFPQYCGVTSVDIGLPAGAKIAKAPARSAKPFLIYGSSITQGACSSRVGTSFTNLLSRMLDADVRNLGFSGAGLCEPVMADYIASIANADELSMIVLDCDANNNDARLAEVYYPFYQRLRSQCPDIPILLTYRPIYNAVPTSQELKRISVLWYTYQMAVASGDTNIYMHNGYEYFTPGMSDIYAVDGDHPNDLGFLFMANKLYPYLYNIIYGNPDLLPVPTFNDFGNYISYSCPAGGFAWANTANVSWHLGYIADTKQTGSNFDQNTNAYNAGGAYSHTDVMTFPKAGTKIWFTLPAELNIATDVALVSHAKKEGGVWKFDFDKEIVRGFGNTKFNYLKDADDQIYFYQTPYQNGSQTFCYITREDNENIRFCIKTVSGTAYTPSAIRYLEPEGPAFYPTGDVTKQKVDVTWNIGKYLQWDAGYSSDDMPFIASDLITIEKAGTTIVWFDDGAADPGEYLEGGKLLYCGANRAYAGGAVGVAAFDPDGTYRPDLMRVRANNDGTVKANAINCCAQAMDGSVRCYYYTTTRDNETIRIAYYGGWDYVKDPTTLTDTTAMYKVRPYDVYMYVPNN